MKFVKFSENVAGWHSIIPTASPGALWLDVEPHKEAYGLQVKWLIENTQGKVCWHSELPAHDQMIHYSNVLYFENQTDLVLYKLAWT